MKTNITFRPLETYPGKRPTPKRSPFRTGYSNTLNLLDIELWHLAAKNVVFSIDVGPGDIRLDGMPRADARPRSPAVVISFDSKVGPLQYPCAAFTTWQDNVRAIALALEALRKVDRYGVTQRAEQYRGWSKIPGPVQTATMTLADAASLLVTFGGGDSSRILRDVDAYRAALKTAQVNTHPDRNGGSDGSFKSVQAARDILDRHHGI